MAEGSATRAATAYAETEKKKRPSVTKRAAGGAVAGAGTGAAIGSVVPGVGTAVGAGVGAAVGGLSGAAEARREQVSGTAYRRALVAEFLLCIIVLALHPLSNPEGETNAREWMKRGTAMCGVFILLGMVSSIGPKAGKAAAALGGLLTVVLVVDQRGIFGVLASKLNAPSRSGRLLTSPEPDAPDPGHEDPPERFAP